MLNTNLPLITKSKFKTLKQKKQGRANERLVWQAGNCQLFHKVYPSPRTALIYEPNAFPADTEGDSGMPCAHGKSWRKPRGVCLQPQTRPRESHPHTQGPDLSSKCRTKGPADPVTWGVQAPRLRSAAASSLPALRGPKSALAHPAGIPVWSEAAA